MAKNPPQAAIPPGKWYRPNRKPQIRLGLSAHGTTPHAVSAEAPLPPEAVTPGRTISTLKPPSAAFSALIVPPWIRMTRSAIASPSPVPPDCRSHPGGGPARPPPRSPRPFQPATQSK